MKRHILLLLFTLVFAGVVGLSGCSDSDQVVAEPGHEGHNHDPGEHSQVAAEPGHEGDNLGLGEHSQTEAELDWCADHAVPESKCTRCNPNLIAEFKASNDWCVGHDLPESHCRLCNPGISFPQEEVFLTQMLETTESEIAVSLYRNPNTDICATDGAIIQFASPATAARTGLSLQAIRAAQYESHISAPAEIVFDETDMTVVTSSVAALVTRWLVSPGDPVTEGDAVALATAPDVAALQSSLVSAYAEYDKDKKELERHRALKAKDLISDSEFEQQKAETERAWADVVASKGLLLSAGMSPQDIKAVVQESAVSNQFMIRATASGMLVDRIARLGELQPAGRAFASIANPSAMWIEARLTEQQIKDIEVGQPLTFSSDGRGINRVGGEIIWVSRFLDPHTRTGTVRARVVDPDHRLHAGEFGRVDIVQSERHEVALVPRDAVQWEGCCNVVFVKEAVDRFRPRKVTLLERQGPYYQVTGGVYPGEEVVVDGAFLLKTELKKTSIGAGCCGLEPTG